MKKNITTMLAATMVAAWGGIPSAMAALQTNQVIEIPVETALAPPMGFDDNDNIQVVLHGRLPNSCFTLGNHSLETLGDGHTIRIHQFANHRMDGICAADSELPEYMKMTIPFTSEISVGQLASGDYQFEYQKVGGTAGFRSLNVSLAGVASVDSLPYAAVSTAMAADAVNGSDDIKVTLSGSLNSTCTELDPNVPVKKSDDVYILLPTIRVKPGVLCAQVMVPFQKKMNLGKAGKPGHYLIHVRSMNGRAVNHVVEVSR
jgi:hypothetical protein